MVDTAAAAASADNAEKDGVMGWSRKLTLLLPLIYILLNAVVQAREITDKIGTETNSGFEGSPEVIISRKEDMPSYVSQQVVDENGNLQWLGSYDRIGWYFYEKTGNVSLESQSSSACNAEFVEKYNSNEIPKMNTEKCRLGTPKVTSSVCANYEHPAYIAISVLWAGYVAVYLVIVMGYTFFSYSSNDIRYYISAVKFKHSLRNRVMLGIGVVLTWLTSAVAFYYLGGGGNTDRDWGEGIQFDDVVEALTKIFIFFIINTKAFADLNKSENYNFDHISMSKDFPDPIFINPCPDDQKSLANLYGVLQTVDEVLFLFEEAYLHALMFDDHSKSLHLSSKSRRGQDESEDGGIKNGAMVKLVVNLFHADDLDDIKARIDEELEKMAKDPVTKSFVADSAKMGYAEKFQVVREQTTEHVAAGLEMLRKLMVMAAPVGLIFTGGLNILMKVGQNAENFQYGGFDVGDRPMVSDPSHEYPFMWSGVAYDSPILPGELSSNMTASINYYDDCYGWFTIVRYRYYRAAMNSCDQSYPAKVHTTNLVCPFTSSAMFVSMLSIWVAYCVVLAALLFSSLKDYSSNDLRFYLVSDSIKETPLWKGVLGMGRVLVGMTFILALAYESMRPYAQWTDFANVFIFLFLMTKVFSEVDSPPFVNFSDKVLSKPFDEVHPKPIPIVVQTYTAYKNSIIPKMRPTSSIFSQMLSLYLKALVLQEPLLVSHMCDYEQVTNVLMGLKEELTVEATSTKSGNTKDGEVELMPTPPTPASAESTAVPPGPGVDNRVALATEDPDTNV